MPILSGLANECVYAQNYISEKESVLSNHFSDGGRHSPKKTSLSYVISEMEDTALTLPGVVSIFVTRPIVVIYGVAVSIPATLNPGS